MGMTHAERGRKGGRSTVARHGRGHMSKIGRRGRAVVVSRYFAGDGESQQRWFTRAGLAAQDAQYAGLFAYVEPMPIHPAQTVPAGQRGLFEVGGVR